MKLDVNDPNFDWELGNRAKVYLDGVEQSNCAVADEEEGYIVRYIIDPEKRILNGDTMTVRRNVKIVIEE